MGIGDLFGIRTETVIVKKRYKTILEIYEDIRDVAFQAGTPLLATSGLGDIVVFPMVDNKNQVRIFYAGKSRLVVQRTGQVASVGNIIQGDVLSSITDDHIEMALGNPKKRCMELATITAQELRALNL